MQTETFKCNFGPTKLSITVDYSTLLFNHQAVVPGEPIMRNISKPGAGFGEVQREGPLIDSKFVRKYIKWMLRVNQKVADKTGINTAYIVQATEGLWQLWCFERNKPAELVMTAEGDAVSACTQLQAKWDAKRAEHHKNN